MKRQKKDVWKLTEKKRERLKGVHCTVYIGAKNENEQFGKKMNQDVNGNRKLF